MKDKFFLLDIFFLKYLFFDKSFFKTLYKSLLLMIEKSCSLLFVKLINFSFFKLSVNISIPFNCQINFSILIILLLKKSILLFEIPIVLD